MIKSDRPRRGPGKNLYIWSRSDQRQATNGFVDLFTFHGPGIYGTNVRAAPRMWKSRPRAISWKKRTRRRRRRRRRRASTVPCRSRSFINLLAEKQRGMPWFLQKTRASRCRRAFSVAGEQRPRGFSTDVAERIHSRACVLHEGRMYARKVKACRSTGPERERERERDLLFALCRRETFLQKLSPLLRERAMELRAV